MILGCMVPEDPAAAGSSGIFCIKNTVKKWCAPSCKGVVLYKKLNQKNDEKVRRIIEVEKPF